AYEGSERSAWKSPGLFGTDKNLAIILPQRFNPSMQHNEPARSGWDTSIPCRQSSFEPKVSQAVGFVGTRYQLIVAARVGRDEPIEEQIVALGRQLVGIADRTQRFAQTPRDVGIDRRCRNQRRHGRRRR